jgi:hypothetical protein
MAGCVKMQRHLMDKVVDNQLLAIVKIWIFDASRCAHSALVRPPRTRALEM